jgi:hypothetical protein
MSTLHLHPIDVRTHPPTVHTDLADHTVVVDVPRPFCDEVDEWRLTAEQAMRYGARLMSAGTALHEIDAHGDRSPQERST